VILKLRPVAVEIAESLEMTRLATEGRRIAARLLMIPKTPGGP